MTNAMQRSQMLLRGTINHKMPPFPCNVLFYSKTPGISSFRVVRFQDQKSFDRARAMTVSMVRVILTAEDLHDVGMEQLAHIYNTSAKDGSSVDATEIPREELQDLVFGIIHNPDAATPYEETTMGTTAEATKEQQAADKKAAKEAKPKTEGVIANIKAALDTKEGTTASEILDKLVAKFPDRTREGMNSTVKIQFSRLAKSQKREIINAKIKGRGRVYKFADKGAIPGEVEQDEAPAPKAPVATSDKTVAAENGGKKAAAKK